MKQEIKLTLKVTFLQSTFGLTQEQYHRLQLECMEATYRALGEGVVSEVNLGPPMQARNFTTEDKE